MEERKRDLEWKNSAGDVTASAWAEKQIKQNAILNFSPTIKNQSREIMKLKHDLYLFVDEKIPQDNGRFMFSIEARGWRHSTKTSQRRSTADDGKNPKCSTKLNFFQLCLTQICVDEKKFILSWTLESFFHRCPPFIGSEQRKENFSRSAPYTENFSLFFWNRIHFFSSFLLLKLARLLAKNNINNKTFIFFLFAAPLYAQLRNLFITVKQKQHQKCIKQYVSRNKAWEFEIRVLGKLRLIRKFSITFAVLQ